MINIVENKNNWEVGEQIRIPLTTLGEFTATAYKITNKGTLFIFDDYVAKRQMNKDDTNKGGFESSDLKRWVDTDLRDAFPEWLGNDIYGLSIPSVGELFGHEEDWINDTFESDGDKQLELMKLRRNRVSYFNNECEFGWLRNTTKQNVSSNSFARVTSRGGAAYYCYASLSLGVRPEFWLAKKTEEPLIPRALEKATAESMKLLKRIKSYDDAACEIKSMVNSFCAAGFTVDQAITIIGFVMSK